MLLNRFTFRVDGSESNHFSYFTEFFIGAKCQVPNTDSIAEKPIRVAGRERIAHGTEAERASTVMEQVPSFAIKIPRVII